MITFPITENLWYTPQQMAAILDLPAGHTHPTNADLCRAHPSRKAGQHRGPTACRRCSKKPRAIRSIRRGFSGKGTTSGNRDFIASSGGCPGGHRPRGLRRELARPESGRGRHRVRPLLAALVRALEGGRAESTVLRLRYEMRRQRRLVCHGIRGWWVEAREFVCTDRCSASNFPTGGSACYLYTCCH